MHNTSRKMKLRRQHSKMYYFKNKKQILVKEEKNFSSDEITPLLKEFFIYSRLKRASKDNLNKIFCAQVIFQDNRQVLARKKGCPAYVQRRNDDRQSFIFLVFFDLNPQIGRCTFDS